jgi:hypothetical protein
MNAQARDELRAELIDFAGQELYNIDDEQFVGDLEGFSPAWAVLRASTNHREGSFGKRAQIRLLARAIARSPTLLTPKTTPDRSVSDAFSPDRTAMSHRPEIGRVIFIAAPLRGSNMAKGVLGNIAAMIIREATLSTQASREMLRLTRIEDAELKPMRRSSRVDSLYLARHVASFLVLRGIHGLLLGNDCPARH